MRLKTKVFVSHRGSNRTKAALKPHKVRTKTALNREFAINGFKETNHQVDPPPVVDKNSAESGSARRPRSGSDRIGPARLGSARRGSGSARRPRSGSDRIGPARLGFRLGSAWLGSAWLGSVQIGPARPGSAEFLSTPPGSPRVFRTSREVLKRGPPR